MLDELSTPKLARHSDKGYEHLRASTSTLKESRQLDREFLSQNCCGTGLCLSLGGGGLELDWGRESGIGRESGRLVLAQDIFDVMWSMQGSCVSGAEIMSVFPYVVITINKPPRDAFEGETILSEVLSSLRGMYVAVVSASFNGEVNRNGRTTGHTRIKLRLNHDQGVFAMDELVSEARLHIARRAKYSITRYRCTVNENGRTVYTWVDTHRFVAGRNDDGFLSMRDE